MSAVETMTLRRRTATSELGYGCGDGDIFLGPLHGRALSSSSAMTTATATTTATKDTASALTLRRPSTPSLAAGEAFTPTSSLQIQADGKDLISLPLPPAQLSIPICDPATGHVAYTSVRATRCHGSCRLVRGDGDKSVSAPVVARTTYRFGPGRSPAVRVGGDDDDDGGDGGDGDEFEVCAGLLTRTVRFASRAWGRFEWRYADRRERRRWAANSLLVLEKLVPVDGGVRRVRVAQLVRNDSYRTSGTRPSTAGNGGRLQMALCGEDSSVPLVDEVLVVATCLVMLKKEIDRRRAMQFMIMGGVL